MPTMADWYTRIPIFAGMSASALEQLSSSAGVLEFPADELLFSQGEPGRSFYLIESGEVEVFQQVESGQEKSIARLPQGDFFGDMAILECAPRSASVRTTQPSLLHEITTGHLHQLYKDMPDQYSILILNIARDLARRLHKMDDQFSYRKSEDHLSTN
ncbi:MAG: cyclic nucleotide-binding domain-containing protein [Gammaproteobacteria bacterium]|nr:cyclic nucleotide-binding domain-containing protein [Gammaproteobacteria bacterium]